MEQPLGRVIGSWLPTFLSPLSGVLENRGSSNDPDPKWEGAPVVREAVVVLPER